jgi:heterodisulfide reductase subunit C
VPRTKDTQLRSIYEKFNKFRNTSNVLSEQMNPREKRQLESSFRAIETNIDFIKQEVKIISKLLMKQGMNKSVREIQQSFKRKVIEFGLDVRNIARQHLSEKFTGITDTGPGYSNPEAQKLSIDAVNKASKEIGKAQNKAVSIFTSDMKNNKYDNMDLIRSIKTGRLQDASFSKRGLLQQLYFDVRDRFNKYGRRRK